ncbi:MAG: UDP-N-acetylglucosamine 2-epimerase (non-hydrolyzing) [Nannocystis sp.]|nr:UDP-N-acetylglucosamine 2-epimerase (non-hydrolyzing) [Nannocystis sp.]MBA3546404.1 UDP-N-acetylglucosamine 2-epimerase (non-hydrolyzing) [Nannocystis sp.]
MPSTQPRILIVFGTRPEVIKLWPVDRALRAHKDWQVTLCNTGQHRELVPPLLESFGLAPEIELGVMNPGQSLSSLMARLLDALDPVLDALRFDWVVVQGDTTTALAATMAAYHRRVPVAHVEAGLRTRDLNAPFPEEGNRQLIARLASLHLAPTPRARDALLAEGVQPRHIEITGNTVVDAARSIADRLPLDGVPPVGAPLELLRFSGTRPLVLITGHRRESFEGGLAAVCDGLAELARAYPGADFVYPVHLNPSVQSAVRSRLAGLANVHLLEPLDYPAAVWLLRRCLFVVTDSGGLQEEAPEFGKPVLVTRESTERSEGLTAGCAELVGYERAHLVAAARRFLDDPTTAPLSVANPYGDGHAAARCAMALRRRLGLSTTELPDWP